MTKKRTKYPKAVLNLLQKAGPDRIARKLIKLDIHDDNLITVKIHVPRTEKNDAAIEFELEDDGIGARKVLSFSGCANLRFVMDFDVMAQNCFAQTYGAKCFNDRAKLKRFVRTQKAHWRVQFMPPTHPEMPIRRKLAGIRRYHLFKIKFYGGTFDILARNFQLKMPRGKH